MSHELRTPLNAIIGFTEMLSFKQLQLSEAKIDDYHISILTSARHLLNLINDILDLAKVDAGKVEVALERVQLNQLIEECARFLEPAAQTKRITFHHRLLPVEIETDPRLIKQIVINLLSNAVKFSSEGTEIELELSETGHAQVLVVVRDQGPGMTQAEVQRAMEPFVQLENSYNRTQEGTGLGLTLVSRFAELIGATLAIESTKGQGTTVSLCLPYLAQSSDAKTPALATQADRT